MYPKGSKHMTYKKNYQLDLANTGNYFLVPNAIYEMKLPASHIMVFGYMISNAEDFHPSIGLISKTCTLSRSTVRMALRNLETRGLLTRVKKPTTRTPAQYKAIPTSQWPKKLPSGGTECAPPEVQNETTYKKNKEEKKTSSFLQETYEEESRRIIVTLLETNGIFKIPKLVLTFASQHGARVPVEAFLDLILSRRSSIPPQVSTQIHDAFEAGLQLHAEKERDTVNPTLTKDAIDEFQTSQQQALQSLLSVIQEGEANNGN